MAVYLPFEFARVSKDILRTLPQTSRIFSKRTNEVNVYENRYEY